MTVIHMGGWISVNGLDLSDHVRDVTISFRDYDPDYDPALDRLDWGVDYAAGDRSPAAQRSRADAIRRESRKRQADGTYGAFSDDELASAAGLAARYVRPDPIEEILGHPGDWVDGDDCPSRTMSALGYTGAVSPVQAFGITIRAAAAADEFQRAMRQIAEAFNRVDTADLLRKIEAATRDARPDIARLRHGRAAICPRHGETRGGTCMKCARGRR